MKNDTRSDLLDEAKRTMQVLLQAGYQAYLVGGFVRDFVLSKPVHDIDIATSAAPADVIRLFERAIPTGIQHGTVTVVSGKSSFEVTTFRREGRYEDHRRPDQVEFVDSLEEDLSRRDFTMNAMAMDIEDRIIDPFGGQADLEKGVLRCVGHAEERFKEDALRMLRCIRFAANYGLTIDEAAWKAIAEHRQLLRYIAMERVRVEFVKTIEGDDPARGAELLIRSRLLAYTKEKLHWAPFTEADDLSDLSRDIRERLDGAVRKLSALSATARMACLLLAGGHTADEANVLLRQLTFSNDTRSRIVKLMTIFEYVQSQMDELEQRDMTKHTDQSHETDQSYETDPLNESAQTDYKACLEQRLRQVWIEGAVTFGKQAAFDLLEVQFLLAREEWLSVLQANAADWLVRLPVWDPGELAVNGHEVMALAESKGPWIGKLLHRLTVDTALGEVLNEKQALLERANEYMEKWGTI